MQKASELTSKKNYQYKLEDNFKEALENKVFKKLCESLKVPRSVLMNYTTRLQEVALEDNITSKCKENKDCVHPYKGFIYKVRESDGDLEFYYEKCPYDISNPNMDIYNLPINLKKASFDNIYIKDKKRVEVIKYLAKYLKSKNKPKALYLSGSFGAGKTYLISALFNELGKQGEKSIVIHLPDAVRSLKESFDNNYGEVFNKLKTVPYLLIDDIGAEYLSPWVRDEVIEPLLDYRMNNNLPTFFTSNYNLKQLEEHFLLNGTTDDIINAKRIMERINCLATEMIMISKNLRGSNGES